jgi:hypothetical protein
LKFTSLIGLLSIASLLPHDAACGSEIKLTPVAEFPVPENTTQEGEGSGYDTLGGTVEDLGAFSQDANPSNWTSWERDAPYKSVEVVDGVLVGTIGESNTDPACIVSGPMAWWLDMAAFRYLEIEFERELSSGHGQLWFRKNGNSLVTPGQTAIFPITSGKHGVKIRIILDLSEFPDWGNGALTGLGLNFHMGIGASKNNTTLKIHRIRIGTDLKY